MGVVRNQSIKNSLSFYFGLAIGAINTVIIYPNVFNDYPEHFGLIQILIAYAVVISTFSSLGIPKTFIRFFPTIQERGQLYFLSFITPLFGFILFSLGYIFFKQEILEFIQASELLQENFTSKNLIYETKQLLGNSKSQKKLLENYQEIKAALGGCGASEKAAKLIVSGI